MIIHEPRIRKENGEVCISARVEFDSCRVTFPNLLWFRLPDNYEAHLTDRADGFAAALLLLSMNLGEDVEIKGRLSPRLLRGLQRYQQIFHSWFPSQFKLIRIRHKQLSRPNNRDGGTASAFSGGVDSFYTLFCSQNSQNDNRRISHGLFVHGFDIPLEDDRTYQIAGESYKKMMHQMGMELIPARTNLRQFSDSADWRYTHGSALIGTALILGNLFSRFFVPSSKTYATLDPWGSDPRVDPLLSTEAFEVVHHDAAKNRVEKIDFISKYSDTYRRLRVCWVKKDGLKNCCRCNNCVRTMLALEVLGALSKYETFPLSLRRRHRRNCGFFTKHELVCARRMIAIAEAAGRKETAFDIRYALFASRVIGFLRKNRITRNLLSSTSIKRLQQRCLIPDWVG